MEIQTEISVTQDGRHRIRGHDLIDLITHRSLSELVFLLWRGDFPTHKERSLLESMLVAVVEHGVAAPSIYVPRVIASTGNPLNAALAAGVLTIGETHGGAVEAAALMLASEKPARDIVAERLAEQRVVPGFGHKVYATGDPRATALFEKAKSLGFSGRAFEKAYTIEASLEEAKGKKLPLNVDGALAASLLELKFDPRYGGAFFIIPRMVGMAAHVIEEKNQGGSYRRLSSADTNKTP